MGQTREEIRDNIVKIVNENSRFIGTGFFIHKEYCVTCHHNIYGLDEIYVEREIYNNETGQQTKRRFYAEWVEEFSDMKKDVAFLKVQGAVFKPLEYWRETYGDIPVVVRGFRSEDLPHFPGGKEVSGKITQIYEIFHWNEEQMTEEEVRGKKKKWNMKPEVNIPVYAFNGEFSIGFSGAPVCYEKDWKVVGMFEAKDDKQGYIIPMNTVIQKFDLEVTGRKVSAPSPTLDAEKILDKGNEYFYKHEYLEAIKQYDIILNDSNYTAALNNKGWALAKLTRYEEAIPYYDKAIAITPNYTDALDNKGYALLYLGRHEEAIKQFDEVLKIDPNYADALNGKGCALGNLGRHEEAIKQFDKAIEKDSNYLYAWDNKGIYLLYLGRHEEAIKQFDEVLKIDPNYADALNNKGWALAKLTRYEEAIPYYDKAIAITPNYTDALDNKAWAFYHLGRHEEAIKQFDEVLKIDPNYADALNGKKSAFYHLDRRRQTP